MQYITYRSIIPLPDFFVSVQQGEKHDSSQKTDVQPAPEVIEFIHEYPGSRKDSLRVKLMVFRTGDTPVVICEDMIPERRKIGSYVANEIWRVIWKGVPQHFPDRVNADPPIECIIHQPSVPWRRFLSVQVSDWVSLLDPNVLVFPFAMIELEVMSTQEVAALIGEQNVRDLIDITLVGDIDVEDTTLSQILRPTGVAFNHIPSAENENEPYFMINGMQMDLRLGFDTIKDYYDWPTHS